MDIITYISSSSRDKTGVNLFHDVFDFVLFTVQDDASLLADLQVLKSRLVFNSIQQALIVLQALQTDSGISLKCSEVLSSATPIWYFGECLRKDRCSRTVFQLHTAHKNLIRNALNHTSLNFQVTNPVLSRKLLK